MHAKKACPLIGALENIVRGLIGNATLKWMWYILCVIVKVFAANCFCFGVIYVCSIIHVWQNKIAFSSSNIFRQVDITIAL